VTETTTTESQNGTAPSTWAAEQYGELVPMLSALRAPFAEAQVGKLPRITCFKCRDAQGKVCTDHAKRECQLCGNWITTAHMHLDYVGHAEVTDRLLNVDPGWDWDFLSRDIDPAALAAVASAEHAIQPLLMDQLIENSPPHFERDRDGQPIGLWITLTVGGITRKGFGSVESRKFDAEKQLIGDALRNAAMRFGVALSLWSKNLLESEGDDRTPPARRGSPEDQAPPTPAVWRDLGYTDEDELRSVSASLRDILKAITSERQKARVRAWCIEHEYTDPADPTKVLPLPVQKVQVAEYRALLVECRDASSQEAAQETADRHAPQGQPEQPTLPTPDAQEPSSAAPGADGAPPEPQPPTEGALPPPGDEEAIPDGVPPQVADDIISEVKLMKAEELKAELRARSLKVGGNVDALGKRLTAARMREWLAEPAS
jgi:hypothetical protein